MKIFKVIFIVAIAYGGYNLFAHRGLNDKSGSSVLTARDPKLPTGFMPCPYPAGLEKRQVMIVAPMDSKSEASLKADRLELAVKREGLSVVRTQSYSFGAILNAEQAAQARAAANLPLPIIFIAGKVKSNPTVQEIMQEYRASLGLPLVL